MTNKETIDRWAEQIIPAVFKAEDVLQKAKPDIRHTSDGMTVYTTWLSDQRLIAPMVLTPHMWKRYAERAKVGKHGIELIKHYFLNNPHGKDSDNQKVVGRSVRWNGEDHISC